MSSQEVVRTRRRPGLDVVLPSAVPALLVAMAVVPQAFTTGDPERCELSRSLDGPSTGHLFGFGPFGCDYWTDTVYAARTSVAVAALTVVGTVAVAVVVGSLAASCAGGSTSSSRAARTCGRSCRCCSARSWC